MPRPIPDDLFTDDRWAVRAPGFASMVPAPRVMTAGELRALDAAATDERALPPALLMENAALHAADLAAELASRHPTRRATLVLAGPGNNGGDGLALARQLLARGLGASVLLIAEPDRLAPDTAMNRSALIGDAAITTLSPGTTEDDARRLVRDAIRAAEPAVIVDALFGTGLSRPIQGPAAGAIAAIRPSDPPPPEPTDESTDIESTDDDRPWIVALDLPSGLDADTGAAPGPCVHADLTVTFAAAKHAFAVPDAQPLLGEIALVPIGIPARFTERFGVPLDRDPRGNWRSAHRRDQAATDALPRRGAEREPMSRW